MKIKFIYIVLATVFLLPLIITAGKPVKQKATTLTNQAPATTEIQPQEVKELPEAVPIESPARSGEEVNWQVIANGGTVGTSTNYIINSTVGQTATDVGNSTNYIIHHGYWQDFGGGVLVCDCEPGEADGTAPINILDIVYLINYKYKGGPAPGPYAICNGDPNIDCVVNILDIVYLINFKYKGGAAPHICEEWVAICGSLAK